MEDPNAWIATVEVFILNIYFSLTKLSTIEDQLKDKWLICFLDLQKSFVKIDGSQCDMNFVNITYENGFVSLEAAMAACLLIGTCHKVQDPGCDRNPKTGGFQLCLRKPLVEASLKSCVYEKTDYASLGAICL